jgi:hypothetical protein
MATTYVEIPADRLFAHLEGIGEKIKAKGGCWERDVSGAEIVYQICLPPSASRSELIVLKVYTSIAKGADSARGCGEDAIRVVVGSISLGEFKPVGWQQTVKRTAPNGAGDRVGAFLERLTEVLRHAYAAGIGVPLCTCGCHMARRESKTGKFWGCTAFPVCRNTKNI